jgi:transglutaminase-like putative cysteine protease
MTQRTVVIVTGAALLVVLTALAAYARVFTDDAWGVPALAAAGVATVLAAGVRRVGGNALVSGAASLLGLAALVDAFVLTTPSTVPGAALLLDAGRQELVGLLRTALELVRSEPAPTAADPSLVLLVVVGAWATAHVAHELAVRVGRPSAALVPAAALWIVPLAMPQPGGRTWTTALPFLIGAVVLLLLDAELDLATRGRTATTPRLSATGASLGLVAVTVGLVVPGVLPGYQQQAWLEVGSGQQPRGYQPIVDVGDRLTLPVDRPVLRVESDRPLYLRLAALDTFDANTWRLGPSGDGSFQPESSQLFSADRDVPFETEIARPDEVLVDVEVLDLENIYVPVPYQPVRLGGDAADGMVYSRTGGFVATGELGENEIGGVLRTGVVPGLRYEVVAAIPDPDPAVLRALDPAPEEVAQWLQLPGAPDRYDRFGDQSRTVYADAGAVSTLDRVLALQSWFTRDGGFEYSVDDVGPLRGSEALDTFVFDTRVGYCEYFATAMAVMLRASDIPARVAVGFLPGDPIASTDVDGVERTTYEVRSSDAHAWVEVLFPGQGWIKFDPTPRSDGATLVPTPQDLDPLANEAQREAEAEETPTPDPAETPSIADDQPVPDGPDLGAEVPTGDADIVPAGEEPDAGVPGTVPVLVVLAVLAAAAVVVLRRRDTREDRDDRERVLAAQRRVLRTGTALGLPRREAATVAEVLHAWASDGRLDADPAARLAALGQRAAFARPGAAVDADTAEADAEALVQQMRAAASARDRWLAPVRPGGARLRGMVSAVLDRSDGRT